MRTLLAAGIVAAGSLGVPVLAGATETVYEINGAFSSNEQSCTQIANVIGSSDCTFGRNRPGAGGGWIGPQFGGGHYVPDGIKDIISYTPTSGSFDESALAFSPAADDGKYAAPITGTFTINDNDTAGDPTDDRISARFSIGAMARNVATGASTRAVQRWTSMDHVMAAIAVNPTATVANGAGGVDYVIGSRGFPAPLCNATSNTDCYPTSNSHAGFQNFNPVTEEAVGFWAQIATGGLGIERTGFLSDPQWTNVQPVPNPPTGNVGARSSATFTGHSCDDSQANDLDCNSSPLVWGGGEAPGFDNMVMKISTNAAGLITSASVYWTEEYRIAFGGPPVGYDNSWQGGTFTFTGAPQSDAPNARDFTVTVIEDTSGNTLDTVTNSVNFADDVTVTIITPPAEGIATVNGDQTVNYDAAGVGPGAQTLVYEATDGTDTDQGTVTINVVADTSPVAPDGPMTISTQGAAPGAATVGTLNLTTLGGFAAGNAPSTVTITTPADPARGTATSTGTTVRYTPVATLFTGTDTFGYTITDGNGDTDSGTIAVTIPDVSPAIADGATTTEQDRASAPLALGITPGNGSVAQHDLAVSTAATSGSCSISGTSLTYTPNAGFIGSDSCVVTITDEDGAGQSDTATISITVTENQLTIPGGGSAVDPWSLALLGALPLLPRRRH